MKNLESIIRETVNEVCSQMEKPPLNEYGPEWNSKLEQALQELEKRMQLPQREDTPFEDLLINLQRDFGLSDYETFLVGENSTHPTSDEFWQSLGSRFAKFVGEYPDDTAVSEDLPLGGDEKYIKQQQNQTAPMPLNVSTATWREDVEGTEEKVEVKLLSPQGTAYFHNHGCIVANHSGTPLKAVCTEMSNRGQRAYYVRLDEA